MRIVDKIDECEINPWRSQDRRNLGLVQLVLIHRIGPALPEGSSNLVTSGSEIAEFFTDIQYKTGGRMPYGFVITPDGTIEQCAPLSIITPGAKGLNNVAINIAVIGDFRREAPSVKQGLALNELCVDLNRWIVLKGTSPKIEGHTEKPGRSGDSNKSCPGKHLVVAGLRSNVRSVLEDDARAKLQGRGIVF